MRLVLRVMTTSALIVTDRNMFDHLHPAAPDPKRLPWSQLAGIAGLALATGDQPLRRQVEQLAQNANQLSAYGLPLSTQFSQERIQAVQNSFQRLLDELT